MNFRNINQTGLLLILALSLLLASSCRKEEESARVSFAIHFQVGTAPLIMDSLTYQNLAGNHYEVNEIQYFISEVKLWKDGTGYEITEDSAIHYVDSDISSTMNWSPAKEFPSGVYDSITFLFGLSKEKNISGLFVNPPERDMFWPDIMGGGYHYMKMNGKWLNTSGITEAFNLHLGIGMAMDSTGIEQFIHNCFPVSLALPSCTIQKSNSLNRFILTMDINSWFESPYTWDWNLTGGQIMQNQEAMATAALNGHDAFSIVFQASGPK